MGLLDSLSQELEALSSKVAPSVVTLEHDRGQGTGFALTGDGHLLTNSHVVLGARGGLRVTLASGDEVEAELVGSDDKTDLAVVRIDGPTLAPLELSESDEIRVGRIVLAVGNPLRFKRSVSLGVISALDRTLPGPDGRLLEGLIQTDAAINPGNSGGPLIGPGPAVMGINTAMIPYAQGIGFAISAATASWVAGVLIAQGRVRRPYLGIEASGQDLDDVRVRATGQGRAVRIHRVAPGGPAALAGLRGGDLVLSANGSATSSIDDLQKVMVLADAPSVRLAVLRGWERHDLAIRPRLTKI